MSNALASLPLFCCRLERAGTAQPLRRPTLMPNQLQGTRIAMLVSNASVDEFDALVLAWRPR
jgi:hypothetical protein